ncbi:MAG: serine/threonine protein kinase, partial [Gemmataceae bacterium]|nr:serine/threonine protein kinase [Gemmataceae bacterium]
MAEFPCIHCGTTLRIRPEQSGGRCPRCRKPVEVPRAAKLDPSEWDYLAPAQEDGEMGRLGGYRVLRVLGAGSMGIVFEAEDVALHRRVALKVMKKAQAKKPENVDRFMQEARSAAKIEHDHIVPIYQVGQDRGVPYLAMKLLQGESLEDRVERQGTLPPEEVVRIGQEIASGLAAAHEQGLIHRDIKPANIWLEQGTGRVRIVDFGLARDYEDEEAAEAERNFLIGTPLYMSPEQARSGAIDPRTDLFSLGAVLYKISTGEQPFKGKGARAVIQSVLKDDPEPPSRVRQVPPVLSRIIMDLLEKDPDDRYRTAEIVRSQLEESKARLHEKPPPRVSA